MRVSNYLLTSFILMLLFFYSASTVYGQKATSDYKEQWSQVDALVLKGLTKSAVNAVDKIYAISKRQKNDPQIIKALLYKFKLQQNIEEDSDVKSIDSIEMEINKAKEPARSIMESIAAQMYWNYFQQNRYKIYNRTNTQSFNKKDIATWTADDLHAKITDLYLASTKDKDILQKQKLESFDAIIINGNARYLRPTLYDLLAHRALDYFKSDERDITRPSYYFQIKDPEVFAPADVFIHHKFTTRDSSSLHQKALLIFQELLAFHLSDTKPDALIDADIERIDFANQYGVMTDKDTLYIAALKNISEKYKDNPASTQAAFLRAQTIYNFAIQSSDNPSKINSYSVNDAKEILDAIVNKYPESEGGINAKNLLTQILHVEINLTTEKVNVPNVPFRTLVTYKNFKSIYFRIIPLTEQLKNQARGNIPNDQIFQRLVNQQNIRTWKQELPNTRDYLSHSVEVKVDALPVGEYVLLGSEAPDFNLNKNLLAAAYFFVSNISFINSGQQYFALDRTSGQPLAGANVQVFNQQYNYNNQTYQLQKQETISADKNGYFKLSALKKNENRNVRFDISYKNDRLFLDGLQYAYNYNNNDVDNKYDDQKKYDEDNAKVFLFTDRSIYRPGQLIYFKGIGITKNWKTKKTVLLQSKDSITVFLNDANGQRVDSINVSLNEYGSFNGKFRLPENKLNGTFEIAVDNYYNSSSSFSVEEYKRPKFYADFEKLQGSYRLGDTVSITGFAKAYAGNNIDGAKVSYHITRQARFLYPWIFWGKILPRQNPVEITNGEINTGTDGKFIIKFSAIPDLSIDKTTGPVFDYKVEADVTDINGETRSSNIVVPIGYKALNLQI
ncbi:MAG: MG2 domain-containing protein, partial [Ginsengibacter sp.]